MEDHADLTTWLHGATPILLFPPPGIAQTVRTNDTPAEDEVDSYTITRRNIMARFERRVAAARIRPVNREHGTTTILGQEVTARGTTILGHGSGTSAQRRATNLGWPANVTRHAIDAAAGRWCRSDARCSLVAKGTLARITAQWASSHSARQQWFISLFALAQRILRKGSTHLPI